MRDWNWRAIRAIVRKDLHQVTQNRMVWLPMILVPAIFLVVFPGVFILLPMLMPASELDSEDLVTLMRNMPPQFAALANGLTPEQLFTYLGANYMFAPMFLIIPLMVSTILAADSIVGERERKTMESLLYTPISDSELFAAKVLTALIPALAINVLSFVLYGVVVNVAGYPAMGRIYFPAPTWWPLIFWLGPAVSVAALGVTVTISSKAKTFMEAQQAAGVLVLPVVVLMIGQVSGLFFLGIELMLGIGLLVWIIGLWLVWVGAKTFARGELIARV
jgi:ABC-type Na+ efflux pump permease subunit